MMNWWIAKGISNSTLHCCRCWWWWHMSWTWMKRKPKDWIRSNLENLPFELQRRQREMNKVRMTGCPANGCLKRNVREWKFSVLSMRTCTDDDEDHNRFAEERRREESERERKTWVGDGKATGQFTFYQFYSFKYAWEEKKERMCNKDTSQSMFNIESR